MIHRFQKVTDGLYRGSAPSVDDVISLHKKFKIKKIVSLDEDAGLKIQKICHLLKIKQIITPLDGTIHSVLKFLHHDLYDLLMSDGPTFVHCLHGKDRTGFIIALFECKYLDVPCTVAMQKALLLGFGHGIDPIFVHRFEKLICKACKHDHNHYLNKKNTDHNHSIDGTIVDKERDDILIIDHYEKGVGPEGGNTKQFPFDNLYNSTLDQSPTRENYQLNDISTGIKDKTKIPLVGIYNNDAGVHGIGPVEPNPGGFIND